MENSQLSYDSPAHEYLKWVQELRRSLSGKDLLVTLDPNFLTSGRATIRKDSVAKSTILEKLSYDFSQDYEDESLSASDLFSRIKEHFKPVVTRAAEEALSELHTLKWSGSMDRHLMRFHALIHLIRNGIETNLPDTEKIRLLTRSLPLNYANMVSCWGDLGLTQLEARLREAGKRAENNNNNNNKDVYNRSGHVGCMTRYSSNFTVRENQQSFEKIGLLECNP